MANTRKQTKKIDNEAAVLEKVAAMPEPYRAMGGRLHELILESSPELEARPWYGMPGYAKSSGPVLCWRPSSARPCAEVVGLPAGRG